MSELTLRAITPDDREVVERLWQLYRHDLSEFRGTHGPEGFRGMLPREDGTYKRHELERYLDGEPGKAGYLLWSDDSPVGFALLSRLDSEPHLLSEFFLVRGARGRGLADGAVDAALARHPGLWEIPFQEDNVAAARFWRRVAARVDPGGLQEERRPVPGKPEVPPDVWLTISIR